MRNKRNLLLIIVIIPILFLLISRTFSLTYTHEIKSVEIQSNDYDNPGSWHIDKSAEWTGFGKARVTFDVNSIMKTAAGHFKDVILVMDISGSMAGDKLDRAKEDAIALTNYLLSDSHNRVALITFDSISTVVSGFTNNQSQIVDYINNLTDQGSTNYNAGLLNIETVMENYVRDENKDLVVLFLTDGYPNEDTPNEKSTYQMLKDKYPYMTINGIQYEMGKDIIQEIIDISDNQYIANIDTLNNVLFDATVVPITYDNFVIEDYIYGDYFYIDSVNDVEVPFGTVTVENVNNTQKVTWNLGNNYVTGHNVKMDINLKLKNIYHNTKGLYPTNQSETIISKLPDENEKTKTSEDTPVLSNSYNVIYETNTPDGCNLPSIPSEEHYVYQTVTKRSDSLSCPGYIFKGWYISSNDLLDTKLINEEMFIMPNHYVTIKGTWTKQDIVKTMDGIVKVKLDGTLMKHDADSSKTFGKVINRDNFESITTVDDIMPPATAIDFWDASAEQNGSVLAWYTDIDNDNKYELYIGQEDGVKANPNSNEAFYYFKNVESIDLTNFDISQVTSMISMFQYAGQDVTTFNIEGISNWDTSQVTNMSSMFFSAGRSANTFDIGDLSNWNTSKVTKMSSMFSGAGYRATTWDIGDISNWDTSNVTNISYMFYSVGYSANTFDIGDISNWDTSQVTNMEGMFSHAGYSANTFDIGDLSNWDTSQVTNMSAMFANAGYNATTFDIGNIGNWDVSNVTTMHQTFLNAGYNATTWNIGDLSSWDTSNVTTMFNMFSRAGYNATTWDIGDLSNWDTSQVTNMSYMFSHAGYSANTFDIGDLSNWDTSSVTDMSYMFYRAGYNSQIFNFNLSNWDTSKVTTMSYMFYMAGTRATTWNVGNINNWNTSKVGSMEAMFSYAGHDSQTFILDISDWDTSSVVSMSMMFEFTGVDSTTFEIDLSNWNVSSVRYMTNMFAGIGRNATTWSIGDLSNWDVSNVTTMESMFSLAGEHAAIWAIGDISNWDTSNVTNMSSMFTNAGRYATTWNNIGTLKVYADNINIMFDSSTKIKVTLNIYSNPTAYANAFNYAATGSGARILVNYSSTTTNIDNIIRTKSNNSNVVKGVQLD